MLFFQNYANEPKKKILFKFNFFSGRKKIIYLAWQICIRKSIELDVIIMHILFIISIKVFAYSIYRQFSVSQLTSCWIHKNEVGAKKRVEKPETLE